MNELAVAQPIRPGGGVDARNPQTAEIPAACATVAVGLPIGLHHGLIGAAEQLAACSPLPFGHSNNFFVSASVDYPTFYSHYCLPRILGAWTLR